MAEPQPDRARAQDTTPRDARLANHLDAYVGFTTQRDEPRVQVFFECCSRAMLEVPLILLASLPPEASTQGVQGRVRCGLCKRGLLVELKPESRSEQEGTR